MRKMMFVPLACAVAAFVIGLPNEAFAAEATHACTPTETMASTNRVHVRCSSSTNDGGDVIWWFAVSTSDDHNANRFLSQVTTALVSGKNLVLHYVQGDTSGASWGCAASSCRRATAARILY